MVVGVYGGSFNPIHVGHVQLGDELVAQGLVDELWYVVSPQNPFKVNQSLLPDDLRLQLASLALEGHHALRVCDIEMTMPRPSYMVNTLAALRSAYPQHTFVLVIGADNWEHFTRWYRHEEIRSAHSIIIYPRPDCTLTAVPDDVTVARTSLIPISSTQIRQAIALPEYAGEGLAPQVWE
ncbi:MAG: nicotinate-nucleotide adenylyltransferase, partial [Bacteroidaceae bacterium]|nr:nicotinate-nucleotide adenylyltransferase [Bacteroidaceae bacterium]